MTKPFIYLSGIFLFFLLLLGCNEPETDENGKEINFTVKGTIKNAEGQNVYVEAPSENGMISIATGTVNSDGSFDASGNITGLGFYQIRLGENQENAIPITPQPKENLTLNTNFSDFTSKPNAKGTSWATTMNSYLQLQQAFKIAQANLMSLQGTLTESLFEEELLKIKKPLTDFAVKKMQANPSNPYNIVLSMELYPLTGFTSWDENNLTIFKKVSDAFLTKYGACPASSAFQSQYNQLLDGFTQFKQIENGEITAPDFTLSDPTGKYISLSDFKGKLVLIDFWASWCGPCRKENPNMIKIFNRFKANKFIIFSVSLDEDPIAWKGAIASDGLLWKTHGSDLKGWKSSMPALYGFDGIPFTVLVNPEGKIIARGLRGPALETKIEEALKTIK